MTTEQFTYWLNGYFEISNSKTLDEKQIKIIKDHLALVLNKQTPDREESTNLKQRDISMEIGKKIKKSIPNRSSGSPLMC